MGTNKRHKLIDWKRNDKVNIGHNVSQAFDFHDVCRVLLMRMLRRKHKDKQKYPIYSEYDCEAPNEDYPDIQMVINGAVYVWELQTKISESWTEQICKKYKDKADLIIIPLDVINEAWENRIINNLRLNNKLSPIAELEVILVDYLI